MCGYFKILLNAARKSRNPFFFTLYHEHVLEELNCYAPLVSEGSYLVVLDTVIGDMPEEFSADRPWSPGCNPKTAVRDFLARSDRFEVDRMLEAKLQITVAPGGYLKCVKKA